MENLLLIILCSLFSLLSVAAIILSVMTFLKKDSNSDNTPGGGGETGDTSTNYCNLDQLTIGNFNITVGEDPTYLILQYSKATYPFIVFNFRDTSQPIVSVVDVENYFYYDFEDKYDVLERDQKFDMIAKTKYPCNRIEKGSITFTNDMTLSTINNNQTLLLQGAKSQFEFNATNIPFKTTIYSSGTNESFCYFDGNYFCTQPENGNTCKGTQSPNMTLQNTGLGASTDKNEDKVDGITFSNNYTLTVSSESVSIQGPLGNMKFNLNDGNDVWTINNKTKFPNSIFMYYDYQNKIGTTQELSKCVLNKEGKFVNFNTPDQQYIDYPNSIDGSCENVPKLLDNNAKTFLLPQTCITGEGSYKDNEPKEGVGQMKFGSCGGGWDVGGKCDLQTYLTDKIKASEFSCPVGTKPFFYTNKNDTSSNNNCNNKHKGIFSNISYVCCDENKFAYDKDNDGPQPSDLPSNKDYCFLQSYQLLGDTTNSSPASILIGRTGSGGDNPPTSEHDGCDIKEEDGLTKLKNLLGEINNYTWNKDNECVK